MSLTILGAMLMGLSPEQGAQTPVSNPDRIICRQRPVTGSRTEFERECRTAREWNTRRREITRGLREHSDRSSTGQPPPGITPGSE